MPAHPARPKRSRTSLPAALIDANEPEDQAILPLIRAQGTAISIETAIAQFLDSRLAEGRSKQTRESYRKVLKLLTEHLAARGCRDIWSVTAEDLESWFHGLREVRVERAGRNSGQPLSPYSIQNYVRHTLACWHWFEERGLVPPHTTHGLHVPAIPPNQRVEPTTFTDEEIEQLFNAAAYDGDGPAERQALAIRNRALLAVLLETGVRRDELVSMRTETIDWEQLAIQVHRSKTQPRLVDMGRDRAPRLLRRYVQVARPWLAEVSEDPEIGTDRGPLWLGRDGRPLLAMGVEKFFQRLHRRVETVHGECSPQVCRRWYITRALQNGVPPMDVARQCGTSLEVILKFYYSATVQEFLNRVKHGAPLDRLARDQAKRQNKQGGRLRRGLLLGDPDA